MIARDLLPDCGGRPLYHEMETVMQSARKNCARHYHGSPAQMRLMCHYSLSDRIRHCWIAPQVEATVCWLLVALRDQIVPLPLMWQHMQHAARAADKALGSESILVERVQDSLSTYNAACRPTNATSHIEDLII